MKVIRTIKLKYYFINGYLHSRFYWSVNPSKVSKTKAFRNEFMRGFAFQNIKQSKIKQCGKYVIFFKHVICRASRVKCVLKIADSARNEKKFVDEKIYDELKQHLNNSRFGIVIYPIHERKTF